MVTTTLDNIILIVLKTWSNVTDKAKFDLISDAQWKQHYREMLICLNNGRRCHSNAIRVNE
jgi:hypothetical protein